MIVLFDKENISILIDRIIALHAKSVKSMNPSLKISLTNI